MFLDEFFKLFSKILINTRFIKCVDGWKSCDMGNVLLIQDKNVSTFEQIVNSENCKELSNLKSYVLLYQYVDELLIKTLYKISIKEDN